MKILILTAMLAAAVLAGCVGGDDPNSTLYVKDALADDVDAVHVTFTSAQVKAEGAGWTTVFEGKERIDLLALSAPDAKESLAKMDLAPGSYDGLRLAVSEVEVEVDGESRLLNVFGNLVQVSSDFSVAADGVDILVDFDLDEGVDLAAGTYTPVVKNVQTSTKDSDGDGIDDVDDIDDDNDGATDDQDDDIDGDGEDDKPRQFHGKSAQEACGVEREEELADAQEDLDEGLAEAQEDLDEELALAAADRDAVLSDANATDADKAAAQAEYEAAVAEAGSEYAEAVEEAEAEYAEGLEEVDEEHAECLRDEDEDERDEDEAEDRDDEMDDAEDEAEDAMDDEVDADDESDES